ncbi:MAG: insulinase family protein [Armatimonadetes bacterium]|nr:insulinase family protein [Armatimonadota bacterium]
MYNYRLPGTDVKRSRFAFPFALLLFLFLGSGVPNASTWKVPIQRKILSNGAVLVVSERHALPFVTINVLVKAGAILDPPGKYGLSSMSASLLTRGTAGRSATQLAEETDFLGASLHAASGQDYSAVHLTILKKDLHTGLDLLADVLRRPTFAREEIEKERREVLAVIRKDLEDPASVAQKAFYEAVFPGHPYGVPAEGTEESVPRITREDIADFYKKYYFPGNLSFVVVGDITLQEAEKGLEQFFGDWPKQEAKPQVLPEEVLPSQTIVKKINKEVTQATVFLGHEGIRRDNPDYYAIVVMNYILGGGGFASRLMDNIRETKGLVYDVSSSFVASKHAGAFQVVLQTKNESANLAISEVLKEIRQIQDKEVAPQELQDAKAYLTGSFPLRLDTNSKIATLLNTIEFYGLGWNYLEEYPNRIRQVTAKDVLRVAKKYLHPDRHVLVVVGDLDKAKIKY